MLINHHNMQFPQVGAIRAGPSLLEGKSGLTNRSTDGGFLLSTRKNRFSPIQHYPNPTFKHSGHVKHLLIRFNEPIENQNFLS